MSQGNNNHTPYANIIANSTAGGSLTEVLQAGINMGSKYTVVNDVAAGGYSELDILTAAIDTNHGAASFAGELAVSGHAQLADILSALTSLEADDPDLPTNGMIDMVKNGADGNGGTTPNISATTLLNIEDLGVSYAGEFATASISLKEYGNFDNLLDVGRDSFQDLKQDLIDDLLDHGFTAQSIMSQGNNNHTPYANELVHGGIDISDVILAGMKLGHEGQTVSTLIASGISELNILSAQGADFAPTIMINGGSAHKILAASQLLGVEGEVIKNFEEHNISWRMLLVPGDANYDGTVDVEDLGILGANFKKLAAQWSLGNFNVDLVVDVADLGIIGANWTSD